MFVGALYPAVPYERGTGTSRRRAKDGVSHKSGGGPSAGTRQASSLLERMPVASHQNGAPCVGMVDCRPLSARGGGRGNGAQTRQAPMTLLPVVMTTSTGPSSQKWSTLPDSVGATRADRTHRQPAPVLGARSYSVVSMAAAAAEVARDAADIDDEREATAGTMTRLLPPLSDTCRRTRPATVDWGQREMDMEEAETRYQIAALPELESSDDDDDDDESVAHHYFDNKSGVVHTQAQGQADGAGDGDDGGGETRYAAASPRTAAARRMVADVLPHSPTSPSVQMITNAHGQSAPARSAEKSGPVLAYTGTSRAHPLWHFQASLLLARRTRLFTDVFAPYCRTHTRMQLVLSKADCIWDVLLAEEGLRASLLQSTWEERSRDVHPLVWLMSTRDVATHAHANTTTTGCANSQTQRGGTGNTSALAAAAAAAATTTTGQGTSRLGAEAAKWRTGDGTTRSRPTLTSPVLARRTGSRGGRASSSSGSSRRRMAANCYDDVATGQFVMESVCRRLLSEHMAQAKPAIPALLDDAYTFLSQPPLKPIYPDELGRLFHILALELLRQMAVMEAALHRLELFAYEKNRHGNARTWLLTLLRLCRDAAEAGGVEAGEPTATSQSETAAFSVTKPWEPREPWAPSSLACQEPGQDDVLVWYGLVESLHSTGVAALKPEHVLDALAAALTPFASPALLTVTTPSLVYGSQPRLSPQSSHATSQKPSIAGTADAAATFAVLPDVKQVDLAMALFALHALGAEPSVFAQRDVTYALQEVTTLIQCACLLCESRRGEDDVYVESTVRFATTPAGAPVPVPPLATASQEDMHAANASSAGLPKVRQEVENLLSQLWDIGVYEVSSHFLRRLMRERAPLFQDALRRVHQTYTTGKPPRPELEVALAATFLKGCYSVLPSSPLAGASTTAAAAAAPQQKPHHDGALDEDGVGGERLSVARTLAQSPAGITGLTTSALPKNQHPYGSAQRTRQEVSRRLRNAYVCTTVQRRFPNSFYLTAVCHEAVAQLREQAVVVLWELFAPPTRDHTSSRTEARGGRSRDGRGGFFLLSTKARRTGAAAEAGAFPKGGPAGSLHGAPFAPTLRRSSATLTPGYHLNDCINPLLLPNAPPPEDTLKWLEKRVQQRHAPRTTLAGPEKGKMMMESGAEDRGLTPEPVHRSDAPLHAGLPAHPLSSTVVDVYDSGLVMDIFKVQNKYRQLHEAPEAL